METDQARTVGVVGIEVAVHSIFDHTAQFIQCVALRVDGITQCMGVVTAVHFVLSNLKDDLVHGVDTVVDALSGRKTSAEPNPRMKRRCRGSDGLT